MLNNALILIRHCQATGQQPDALLTESGRQQARALAEFLSDYPVDFIVASQFTRAQLSIEPYAEQAGLPINLDSRLNERTLSAQPIVNWQEIVRGSFDDRDLRAPGGESAREVVIRAWAALDEILNADHSLPLVVTHGNLMALVLHSLDPIFGYEGWSSLTNPDVFMLHENDIGDLAFERIW